MPATVHHGDGHVMSFWRYCRPPIRHATARTSRPSARCSGTCTPYLRRYPRALPELAALQDIPAFLARPQTQVNDTGRPPWPPLTKG